ncbi:SH3 domain-containing protein [Ornithinibacillus sp. L9]|uniref:SH3 domain-containing protein n=1 Tax=Ornithinibacillus caprae TaxID=2678566 RepID=A0A6N8FDC7_9BACI|nr:N-acetylmuramoyl-L-alanine amidase [Ornithinibacillus caprae]MUK87672.1 SH3 domain-containing protein [Ornithinibacillus caprae]
MKKLFNRILVTGFFFTLFFFGPTLISSAEANGQLFEVDTSFLNMRTGPSHETKIIGQLEEGDRLRIFEEEDGWVKTFYNGESVWVSSRYLIFIEEDTEADNNNDPEDKKSNESTNQETENPESESTDEMTEDYFRVSDFIGSEPLFIDLPEGEHIDGPLKKVEARNEQVSNEALEITDELLEDYQIVIDPGHGGKDAGAIANGIEEKELTLTTAEKVAEHLEHAGADVVFTRENDDFVSLDQRIHTSHKHQADAFISLHFDSFADTSVNGFNTYYYHDTSFDLAKSIHTSLMQHVDIKDRGIRKTGYLVLRKNQNPSVLLELGFMSNPDNLDTIQTETYQNKVAEAITDGLIEFFDED